MTKEELQKQNDFLLLQLKIINQALQDTHKMNEYELSRVIATAKFHSDINDLRKYYSYIQANERPYNLLDPEMNIDDYKI